MLVLTRKAGETIRIGSEIVVKVIQTGKGSVKLGIEAPPSVRVLRGELQEFATRQPAASTMEQHQEEMDLEIEKFLSDFGDLFDVELDLMPQEAPVLIAG